MGLSDKPGVLGVVGNLGQQVKQGVVNEIKKTTENSVEQLGFKEKKELSPEELAMQEQAAAMKKKENDEFVKALYGISPTESPPAAQPTAEKPVDLKTQLGFGEKPNTTGNLGEQLGVKTNTAGTSANPLEQIGLGSTPQPTASASEQLNFMSAPQKTAEQQQTDQKIGQTLHNEYYQRLTTQQGTGDTEERQKEAMEEQETEQQRMERLQKEDLQKKEEEKEKKKPIAVDQAQNMEKNRGAMG